MGEEERERGRAREEVAGARKVHLRVRSKPGGGGEVGVDGVGECLLRLITYRVLHELA